MAGPEQVAGEVEKALASYGTPSAGHGHVFNLGHGISQFTPPESVTAMVEAVHNYSRQQRRV
jgi:uroporphyrinogen decarboxylase